MYRRRLTVLSAATAALVLGISGPAGAAVAVVGQAVSGDGANDNIAPFCSGGVLAAPGSATTGDPCATLIAITVSPGGGTDTVNLGNVTRAAFPAHIANLITSSDGLADTLTGSPLVDDFNADDEDVINAGDGDDRISGGNSVDGGAGDDTLLEFFGDGTASGGSGDDRFVGFLSQAGNDGGPGTDSWELDVDTLLIGTADPTVWTLGPNSLTITGLGPAPTVAPVTGFERVYLTMMQASVQTYDGTTFPGRSHVRGVGGVDNLTGGALDDQLYGGSGNDTLTGNGGSDELNGGDGDDTIQARDGVADKVDCGGGTDTVVADAVDVVTGCESVQLPPAPPPPAPQTGKIKGPGSVVKPAKAKFTFTSPTAGATFQCKVDRKAWKVCSSPYKVKTKKLDPGKHKLQVRAVVGGVVDATPSKAKFKVKAG